MTAVQTLTVIESDSLTKSIDEEYPNPTKAKNAFTIVRLRRHTFPQPTLYLSTQWTKTYESNWVAVESPRLMRVPAGTYTLKEDGTFECILSSSSPSSLERKNSGDLETIEEEPFNNAEIPGLIEACSLYVVSYEARNPGSQHDAAVIEDYYHAPRLRTQHRRTASQASSSRQSSQSPPPKRPSISWFRPSGTATERTGSTEEELIEDLDLFNGNESKVSAFFGEELVTSIKRLYLFVDAHSFSLSDKENRAYVPVMSTLSNLRNGLKDFVLNYATDNKCDKEQRDLAIIWLLGEVQDLRDRAKLSGIQQIIKWSSRIAGAIIAGLGAAAYIPAPVALASIGTTITVGSFSVAASLATVSTMGLFAAGAFCGYKLGKALCNNAWDPEIPLLDHLNSLIHPVSKEIRQKFPDVVVERMRLK